MPARFQTEVAPEGGPALRPELQSSSETPTSRHAESPTDPPSTAGRSLGADPTLVRRPLRLALPKGRTNDAVLRLLADAGLAVSGPTGEARGYRPRVSGLDELEVKLLKPQAIVSMLDSGSRDLGFAGADWVSELDADVVELLDTELDPVELVIAAPNGVVCADDPTVGVRIASEYVKTAERWLVAGNRSGRVIRSFGATEVLPPEDADCILDITQSGSTLRANGLVIVEVVMRSSTRLYASRGAWNCPHRRMRLDELALLLRSALEARQRLMVELNVSGDRLDAVLAGLPCMRRPTIAPLHDASAASAPPSAFAIKAAVPKAGLPQLILSLKQRGASDIVITPLRQVVP